MNMFRVAFALVFFSIPLSAMAETSVTKRVTFDRNYKAGTSDAHGDRKSGEVVLRRGGDVYAVYSDLITSQQDIDGKQFDTAISRFSLGKEYDRYALYGSFGYRNGGLLESAQKMVSAAHRKMGWGNARTSQASGRGGVTVGFAGRYDHTIDLNDDCRTACTSFSVTPYVASENLDVSVGVATFFNVYASHQDMALPDIGALPATKSAGTYLRVGLVEAFDVYSGNTTHVDEASFQLKAAMEVGVQYGSWAAGLLFHMPLYSEVANMSDRPIPYLSAKLTKSW